MTAALDLTGDPFAHALGVGRGRSDAAQLDLLERAPQLLASGDREDLHRLAALAGRLGAQEGEPGHDLAAALANAAMEAVRADPGLDRATNQTAQALEGTGLPDQWLPSRVAGHRHMRKEAVPQVLAAFAADPTAATLEHAAASQWRETVIASMAEIVERSLSTTPHTGLLDVDSMEEEAPITDIAANASAAVYDIFIEHPNWSAANHRQVSDELYRRTTCRLHPPR